MYNYYDLDKIREILKVDDPDASYTFLLSYGEKYLTERYADVADITIQRKGKTGILIKTKNKKNDEYTRIISANINAQGKDKK